MKAFVLEKYGTPIREVHMPDPVLGDGEVLVRMLAAGVNHGDERLRSGEFKQVFPFSLPMIVGSEFAGEVVATSSTVTAFQPGMRVFAYPNQARMGAFAEMIAIHQDHLAASPESVDAVQAAAIPLAGLTAWQALAETAQIGTGSRVLINGAAGGVGHFAVQIAKARGAHVVALASTDKVDFVRALGSDEVIDYTTTDFAEVTQDIDAVLEVIGGDYPAKALAVLKPGGMLVSTLPQTLADVTEQAAERDIRLAALFVEADRLGMTALADLVATGQLTPTIAATYPLARAGTAQDTKSGPGKTVLTIP